MIYRDDRSLGKDSSWAGELANFDANLTDDGFRQTAQRAGRARSGQRRFHGFDGVQRFQRRYQQPRPSCPTLPVASQTATPYQQQNETIGTILSSGSMCSTCWLLGLCYPNCPARGCHGGHGRWFSFFAIRRLQCPGRFRECCGRRSSN